MKSIFFYVLLFVGVFAWLHWKKSTGQNNMDLQATLDEQRNNQNIGNGRLAANIANQPPWWSDENTADVNPDTYNPQSPINNTDAVNNDSVWSSNPDTTYGIFGTTSPSTP